MLSKFKPRKVGTKAIDFYKEVSKVIPGGVTSNARYVEPCPFFAERGEGSRIFDIDGNEYIDYLMAWGVLLFGHARPESAIRKIEAQLRKGFLYGSSHELEYKVAKEIVSAVPCAEMVRFSNSGSEAIMHAIRVARYYTGRDKIAKFEGAYHGWGDSVIFNVKPPLDKAGSAEAPLPVPGSQGIPKSILNDIVVLPFNNAEAVQTIIEKHRNELAALIVDPLLTASGVVMPEKGFLDFLRDITKENDVVLIFDEVITGFRLGLGGAQDFFRVTPDIAVLGKILGGGLPIGALAGRRDLMETVNPAAPEGAKVLHSGTFNGNSLTLASSLAIINELKDRRVYSHINRLGDEIRKALLDLIRSRNIKAQILGVGSMIQIYFTNLEITDYRSAATSDERRYREFRKRMMEEGIYIHPERLGRWFISFAHTDEDKEQTLKAAERVLKKSK